MRLVDKDKVLEEILRRVKDTFLLEDVGQDAYINKLTSNAFDEFLLITGADSVSDRYIFVIEGVVEKRYVRRGSEGYTSENSDGYSVTYRTDTFGDFEEYRRLLSIEYNLQDGNERPNKVGVH